MLAELVGGVNGEQSRFTLAAVGAELLAIERDEPSVLPAHDKITPARPHRQKGRSLVLVARETPLSTIHLENMLALSRMGVTILPPMPAFYNKPVDSTEMARQFVYRVLAHIGLPQNNAYVWKGGE